MLYEYLVIVPGSVAIWTSLATQVNEMEIRGG